MTTPDIRFEFDNTYAQQLDGMYVAWTGDKVPNPQIVQLNRELAAALGLDAETLGTDEGAAFLSGARQPDGASPLAMAYAGHQFGGFSPQLGDGRAILLGEIVAKDGNRYDLHLKGSGRTPFSRGGDGKAVLGPVLREYLMGEAMHALGVPTTRALAAVTTGEQIQREGVKPGAVLARVASSHLRVGTFQFFAARKDTDSLRKLADYAIARHDPELAGTQDQYLAFLKAVIERQAKLVARWVSLGFVHGVMNTDNVTISGETIDYGPCAFIDAYDPNAVYSSIDRNGRYAFGNQPNITHWNLARLAETLLPLINPDDINEATRLATTALDGFIPAYTSAWGQLIRDKIGLSKQQPEDDQLIADLFLALDGQNVDYTQFFRALANDPAVTVPPLFDDPSAIADWLAAWTARGALEDGSFADRAVAMNRINPVYIPRNHLVEEALAAAEAGDYGPFEALLAVLKDPFSEQTGKARYTQPAPADFGPYKTFCGT